MAQENPVIPPVVAPAAEPNAPTTPAPVADPKADISKVSGRFAALSRKERAIVQRQQEVQAKEADLAKREAALKAFDDQWKADPTKAAESRGLTYAEWTQRVLNDGKPSPESEVAGVREDVARLRKEREDEKEAAHQAAIAAEKASYEKVMADFHSGVKSFVKANSEEYELVNLHQGADDLVIATIEEHFERTKEILDTKKACEMVEKYLEDQVIKSTETKKFKAKATPQPEADPKQSPTKPTAASQQKTLSNNMTASAPGFLPAKNEKERIARAMAALERAK